MIGAVAPRRFGRRRLLVLIATVLTASVALRLGIWQLDRAAEKQALQERSDSRLALPALPAAALATSAAAAVEQYQRRISVRGSWLSEATVFLDNRQLGGRPGFFVMTPLRLDDHAASGPAPLVWVQRGWIARDNNDRMRLPALTSTAGSVAVTGRVAPPPARLFELAADAGGPIRQNLDLDASSRELAQPVLPLTIVQTEPLAIGPDGLSRQWPAPAADTQKHYGYAFQWLALSALIAGLYVWYQIILPLRSKRETP